jgi:uncharacterized protein
MNDTTISCTYFGNPGPVNTAAALQIAKARADALGIRSVIVATTTGETGVRATKLFQGYHLTVVTHVTGFNEPNQQELTEENRRAIVSGGGQLVTAGHSFGGVGRAVRNKMQTYELDEIIAYTLRVFGQGTKVVSEIATMAANAGLVHVGEPAISIAGTGSGADTAVVLLPANSHLFFDLRILEVLCKPRLYPAAQ